MTVGEPSKAELRRQLRDFLGGLSAAQIHERSCRIAEQLFACPEYQAAKTVMAFMSLMAEADTDLILEDCWKSGKRVLVPRTDLDQKEITAVEIHDGSGLTVNRYGIREPADGEAVTPDRIALILVPGLGFDVQGARLGRGGGYYDKFLAGLSPAAIKCGLGFEEQVRPRLPAARHDVKMDMLVTDTEVRRFT